MFIVNKWLEVGSLIWLVYKLYRPYELYHIFMKFWHHKLLNIRLCAMLYDINWSCKVYQSSTQRKGQAMGKESNNPGLMGKSTTRVAVLGVSSIPVVFRSRSYFSSACMLIICNIASGIPDNPYFSCSYFLLYNAVHQKNNILINGIYYLGFAKLKHITLK